MGEPGGGYYRGHGLHGALSVVKKIMNTVMLKINKKILKKKIWSIYTMEYYVSIRKDEYPTFVSTRMGLEEIMLNEISQAERVNDHMVSLICGA